jgi:hypothetical protein
VESRLPHLLLFIVLDVDEGRGKRVGVQDRCALGCLRIEAFHGDLPIRCKASGWGKASSSFACGCDGIPRCLFYIDIVLASSFYSVSSSQESYQLAALHNAAKVTIQSS